MHAAKHSLKYSQCKIRESDRMRWDQEMEVQGRWRQVGGKGRMAVTGNDAEGKGGRPFSLLMNNACFTFVEAMMTP